MPVQTAIQVRRGTASSWTSTNPTLAAGEIGFETDTGKFKIGTGSTAWASLAYAAIDAGLLAAKGDLVTATANDTPAVLTVGSNGDTLVADSSTSTGLRWQGNFAAGKNKIINGDFGIWQRGTSFTNPPSSASYYTVDRWCLDYANANPTSASITQQTFTPGTAPVAGYEGQFFARSTITTVGSTTIYRPFTQRIEDVRTFAGQTVTLSFWAKADSARTLTAYYSQIFGTGGSTQVSSSGDNFSLTTSWQRFSLTFSLGSISGKTIGTNSYLLIMFQQAAASGSVLDLWGVQLEAGNTATAFQTATGTLAGELAACQRYYWRQTGPNAYSTYAEGYALTTTAARFYIQHPVTMRSAPGSVDAANLGVHTPGISIIAATNVAVSATANIGTEVELTVASGLTQYRPYGLSCNNNAAGYIGFSAEL